MVGQDHGAGSANWTAGLLGGAGGDPSPDPQVPHQLRMEVGDGEPVLLPHSPERGATRCGTKDGTTWPWGVTSHGPQCLPMAPGPPWGCSVQKLLGGSPERCRKMPKP